MNVLFEVGACLTTRLSALDPLVVKALKAACTHRNPDAAKVRAMGRNTYGVPPTISTWRVVDDTLHLPRGVTQQVRDVCAAAGLRAVWRDRMVRAPVQWPQYAGPDPRVYQERGIEAVLRHHQGIVRAPTGAGKSILAMAALPRIGQRTCVVVRNSKLAKQWRTAAGDVLGIRDRDVGTVGAGRCRVGAHLTVAMQQTLWSSGFDLAGFVRQFGCLIVDEVQDAAARTVQSTVSEFPAAYRVGLSADHRRRDRKEFLTLDAFGRVICEIERDEVRRSGNDCQVVVRMVPTGWRAPWYESAPVEERNFVRLIAEMVSDQARNALLRRTVVQAADPVLVFTHRREHARQLVLQDLACAGLWSGLMLGGADDAAAYEETLRVLLGAQEQCVGVGTYQSIGTGIDIPRVVSGVCSTPIGKNRQFFNQVRGRVARPWPGKQRGYLYYMWDEHVFPDAPRQFAAWNDDPVEVLDPTGNWVQWR